MCHSRENVNLFFLFLDSCFRRNDIFILLCELMAHECFISLSCCRDARFCVSTMGLSVVSISPFHNRNLLLREVVEFVNHFVYLFLQSGCVRIGIKIPLIKLVLKCNNKRYMLSPWVTISTVIVIQKHYR